MDTKRVASCLLLSACAACTRAADRVVPNPSNITLGAALVQTVDALNAARYRSAQYPYAIGLNPCTVQVTFKITAGGESLNKLVLDLSATVPSGPKLGLDGTISDTAIASRSNEIALTLTSPACNPPNTLGSTKPDKVAELERQIEAARNGDEAPRVGRRGRGRLAQVPSVTEAPSSTPADTSASATPVVGAPPPPPPGLKDPLRRDPRRGPLWFDQRPGLVPESVRQPNVQ